MSDQRDDRSPLAMAAVWVSHATTIGLEMALPALAGRWLDKWLGTSVLFLLLGAAFGFAAGMWHLLRLAARSHLGAAVPGRRRRSHDPREGDPRSEEP